MYVWMRLRPHSDLKSEWPPGPRKVLRYTINFSQNSLQSNPLQVFQKGPYREGDSLRGLLHISQKPHLSASPVKDPSPRPPLHGASWESDAPSPEPLHPALKVPGRRAVLQVPQTEPLRKEMPVSRALSKFPSGSPAREPSLQVSFTEFPQRERHSIFQSPFQPYLQVRADEPTTGCPTEPSFLIVCLCMTTLT